MNRFIVAFIKALPAILALPVLLAVGKMAHDLIVESHHKHTGGSFRETYEDNCSYSDFLSSVDDEGGESDE